MYWCATITGDFGFPVISRYYFYDQKKTYLFFRASISLYQVPLLTQR